MPCSPSGVCERVDYSDECSECRIPHLNVSNWFIRLHPSKGEMGEFPIRQTFELEKSINTAEKSILNLEKF